MRLLMKLTIALAAGIALMSLPSCFQAANNNDPINTILKSHGGSAVVMFHKSGCPFSGYLSPIFDRVGRNYGGKLYFHKITVTSSNQNMFKRNYGFSTFPTVAYFKSNKLVKKHGSGNRTYTEDKIKGHIQQIYGL